MCGTKPHGTEETMRVDRFDGREPENLVSRSSHDLPDPKHPSFRIGDNEHPELVLSEALLRISGQGEFKIVSDLFLPHREALVSKINLEEGSDGA